MPKVSISTIKKHLTSHNADDCMYAIRACCIQKISDENIVQVLKKLKTNHTISMMHKISDAAVAALAILKIEEYSGSSKIVQEMIDTCFYSQ